MYSSGKKKQFIYGGKIMLNSKICEFKEKCEKAIQELEYPKTVDGMMQTALEMTENGDTLDYSWSIAPDGQKAMEIMFATTENNRLCVTVMEETDGHVFYSVECTKDNNLLYENSFYKDLN